MTYDFKDEHGNEVTLCMSLAAYEAAKVGDDTIRHDGAVLTRVYRASSTANDTKFKPIVSESMGCHPDQRDGMIAECKRAGVPTEYTADGCPVLTSQAHKRAFMGAFGYHEKNAFC